VDQCPGNLRELTEVAAELAATFSSMLSDVDVSRLPIRSSMYSHSSSSPLRPPPML